MSDDLIEVRIRHVDEVKGKRLCGVPFDRLDEVIPILAAWGVLACGNYTDSLSGQFVLGESGCFFEVLVGDDGE